MSNFTRYITKIGNLNPALLKSAIEFFAQQIGATVFYGRATDRRYSQGVSRDCIVGFKTNEMPNGIAFDIDSAGNLMIIGDDYNQEEAYTRFEKMANAGMLTNSYLIAMRAQQQQAQVQIQVEEDQITMQVEIP